jgi:hypothetical protein
VNEQRNRDRQEYRMRWIIFFTAQITGLSAGAAAVIHGPSVWTGASTASMVWLVRWLFLPGSKD